MTDLIKQCRNLITGVVAVAILGAILVLIGYGMSLLIDNFPFIVTWLQNITHDRMTYFSSDLGFWGNVRNGLFVTTLYLLFGILIICAGALLSQFGEFVFEIYSERKGRHHAS